MQSHSTPTESQPHEISTSITINATDEQTSPEGLNQQQRLFEPPLPPPATIIARGDSHQPPPSYEEINDPNGTNKMLKNIFFFLRKRINNDSFLKAPPPSYDSLFGRVREVRKTSRGFVDFIKNLFFFLLGKSMFSFYLPLSFRFPI
jgi:hypothetical protein